MPTRQEIAAWLREAANIAYEDALEFGCFEDEARQHAKEWEQRAAQVEAMRCETCRYWDTPSTVSIDGIGDCLLPQLVESGDIKTFSDTAHCGCNFGCFAHEPKEMK